MFPVEKNTCEHTVMSTKAEERQLRGAGTDALQVVSLQGILYHSAAANTTQGKPW